MSAIKRASEIVGSQQKLAALLGVTSGAVSQWEDGNVPIPHCIPIEKLTHGRVRCEELRADVDWAYLRAPNCPTVGASDTANTAPAEPEASAPARALACASQSVRLTADRRQLTRREKLPEAAAPDQLPLLLDDGETHQEAA